MRRPSVAVVCLAGLLALVVATPVGPVQLSYVESGSMAPAIQSGDGYVIHRTTDVEPGDVVTFRSPGSDEYVTHRIVGETDGGYVTKGDANPSTDQSGGHPPVTESAIVGRVVTVGGGPLVVPHARAVATAVDRYRVGLAALAALLVLLTLAADDEDRIDRARSMLTVGDLVRTMLAVAVLTSGGVLLATATTETLTYVAVETSYTPRTVAVGEPATRNVSFTVSDVPGVDYLVHVDGATLVERTEQNGTTNLTLSVPPQERIGPHDVRVRFVRYPTVVPDAVASWLAERHTAAVAALSVLVAYLPLYLGYRLIVDPRAPVRLPRSRTVRRWLR